MKYLKAVFIIISAFALNNCVQKVQPKSITVKVDMSEIKNVKNVGLRGVNPLSWHETTFLSDNNSDGIYEGTFDIYTANYDVEFKFVKNTDEFELKGQNNRSLTFEYKPETIIYEVVFDNIKQTKITRQ